MGRDFLGRGASGSRSQEELGVFGVSFVGPSANIHFVHFLDYKNILL